MRKTHIAFSRLSIQAAAIVSLTLSIAYAQQPQQAITLAKSPRAQASVARVDSSPAVVDRSPSSAIKENYREFAAAKMGRPGEPEFFTLEFHVATKVTAISATPDFRVSGGTCITGHMYAAGNVCDVGVVFTPHGAGHRTGQLSVAHSASATPFLTPIGGTAYAPAVTFIPSQMATVPGTYGGSGSTTGGTLLNPQGLAIDGGDNLYIADTDNNVIKFRDSSGVISVFAGGGSTSAVGYAGFGSGVKLTGPRGVAVDYSGTVYIADTGDNIVLVRYLDGILNNRLGDGATTSCPYSSPCSPSSTKISAPYSITTDPSGNIYVSTKVGGSLPGYYLGENDVSALTQTYYTLGTTAYNYYSTSSSLAVDNYSNLLYTYEDPGGPLLSPTPLCYILGQNRAYSTGTAGQRFWTVAGSGPCGFSGDGGRATGAEISTNIGQFGYDPAGNFYFADTGNNRIRRVDVITGIIRTVAGSGTIGIGGDGGPSTAAHITNPTGLALDSNGRVFVTGLAPSTSVPTKAEVRVFGNIGQQNFGILPIATASPAMTVLLSNVGNDTLNITHGGFSSGNTTDFTVDPNTTTCNFTLPLYSGHSCYIGFIFKPTATGVRTAVYSLTDDTVSGVNKIVVAGTGTTPAKGALSPTSLSFSSQAVGTSSAAKTITLSNSGGVPLTINSYSFTGTNATDFSQTHTCTTSVPAASHCNINVVFKPLAAGSRSATLSVSTASGTVSATLTATAVAAITTPKTRLTSTVEPRSGAHGVAVTSKLVSGTD